MTETQANRDCDLLAFTGMIFTLILTICVTLQNAV